MIVARELRLWNHFGQRAQTCGDLLVEPHDLWIGVYWRRTGNGYVTGHDRFGDYTVVATYRVYICLLPALPLRVLFTRLRRGDTPPEGGVS